MCKSVRAVHEVEAENNEGVTPFFRGTVDTGEDPWFTELSVRRHKVTFKIDTGADVAVISESTFKDITDGRHTLRKSDRPLIGPGGTLLQVLDVYPESISKGKHTIQENVYVVRDLYTALISRSANVKTPSCSQDR